MAITLECTCGKNEYTSGNDQDFRQHGSHLIGNKDTMPTQNLHVP